MNSPSNPERPSFASPCDLDELKHQVREKAIAELKEYIDNDGAWDKPIYSFGLSTTRSACGTFVAERLFVEKYSFYSFSYKGVQFWSLLLFLGNLRGKEKEAETEKLRKNRGMFDLHRKSFEWSNHREDCIKYAKALGLSTPYQESSSNNSAQTTSIGLVVSGGLFLLALIIGVILL